MNFEEGGIFDDNIFVIPESAGIIFNLPTRRSFSKDFSFTCVVNIRAELTYSLEVPEDKWTN